MSMKQELKIIGVNPVWISALLTSTFLIVCANGGENVHWGYLGFELIFPFYLSVVIGEWCKTRTDPIFEVIAAQSKSLFCWIVRRFLLLFGLVSIFAFAGMAGIILLKPNMSFGNLAITFLPTAFFLSSLCVLISVITRAQHIPTMIVGVLWLFSVMSISLLRFKAVQYFYLFARYAEIQEPVWIINKGILLTAGIVCWICTYVIIKKQIWAK